MFSLSKQLSEEKTGFSLLELLTVLLILGIFAAVAIPATGRLLQNIHFRQQTRKIMSTLRYARLMSISKGEAVHLSLDTDESPMFRLTGAVVEDRHFSLDQDDFLVMTPTTITFYPESFSTPGTLTLTIGKRTQLITLDPLTSLPLLN